METPPIRNLVPNVAISDAALLTLDANANRQVDVGELNQGLARDVVAFDAAGQVVPKSLTTVSLCDGPQSQTNAREEGNQVLQGQIRQLRQEVTGLRAKVSQLSAQNADLAQANAGLHDNVNQLVRRIAQMHGPSDPAWTPAPAKTPQR